MLKQEEIIYKINLHSYWQLASSTQHDCQVVLKNNRVIYVLQNVCSLQATIYTCPSFMKSIFWKVNICYNCWKYFWCIMSNRTIKDLKKELQQNTCNSKATRYKIAYLSLIVYTTQETRWDRIKISINTSDVRWPKLSTIRASFKNEQFHLNNGTGKCQENVCHINLTYSSHIPFHKCEVTLLLYWNNWCGK